MLRSKLNTCTRLLFVVLSLAFFFQESNGQTNGGFESFTCPPNELGSTAQSFYNQCVPGWNATHGNPIGIDYAAGKHGADLQENSGIVTSYNFEEGHVYTLALDAYVDFSVSLSYMVTVPVNLYVVAANGLSNSNGSIPTATNSEMISVISVSNRGVMATKNLYNYIPKKNYSQLWFYWQYTTPPQSYQFVMLDNVVVTNNCPTRKTIYFQNMQIGGASFYDGVIIKAGSTVLPYLQGPVDVLPNSNVQFWADDYINLESGFTTDNNAVFAADIRAQYSCLVSAPAIRTVEAPAQETSVNEVEQGLQVAPNPTAGEVTVFLPHTDQNADLTLIDQMGKMVMTQSLSSQQTTLDLSSLHSGVYTLKVLSNGKLYYLKVVLQH